MSFTACCRARRVAESGRSASRIRFWCFFSQGPIEGTAEAGHRLFRQPDDQIQVDAGKSQFARPVEHLPDQGFGLDAIDRLLHIRVHVLHAERHPVEARFAQRLQVRARQFARIDLAADFGIVGQGEMRAHHRHQAADVVGIQVGGRAAAPMQLAYPARGIDQPGGTGHFLVEAGQVGLRLAVIARRHHVAAAVVAQRVAERDMGIQRQAAIRRRLN